MQYRVLASDYDETLATDGSVMPRTLAAVERLQAAGGHLVLVTGRVLPNLLRVFAAYGHCEWIVAENGALLYRPATGEEFLLGEPLPAAFVEALEERLGPIYKGHIMIATSQTEEAFVMDTAARFGLRRQAIYNKGAAMFLPPGVDKASGLRAVAQRIGVPLEAMVGIGDAENDEALLNACGFAVAVANALPVVKSWADWVTAGDHGAGVVETIDRMLRDELPRPARRQVELQAGLR